MKFNLKNINYKSEINVIKKLQIIIIRDVMNSIFVFYNKNYKLFMGL